jgi:hypothetical protein
MKYEYWSCSKFADWLRGTSKIHSGTAEEWNVWRKAAKAKKEKGVKKGVRPDIQKGVMPDILTFW